MKNPQLENGHLKLANEIVDQLAKLTLNPNEWKILWAVWRKTYCWHKKSDWISISQFESMTGMNHAAVCRSVKTLVSRAILVKQDKSIWFNKYYHSWVVSPAIRGGITARVLPVSPAIPTKETITKEIIGTRFTRPSLTQVREYCQAKNYTFDPEAFMAHYDSNGWKVGRNPMKCWKAACTTWQKNERKTHNKHPEQVEYPDMEAVKQWQRDIGLNPDK